MNQVIQGIYPKLAHIVKIWNKTLILINLTFRHLKDKDLSFLNFHFMSMPCLNFCMLC